MKIERSRWERARLLTAVALAAGLTPSMRAQDPLKLLPQNYKLILDNAQVAVIRAHYGPHEKIPVHDHTSYSTVFVYLSDSGLVRIDHAEEGEAPVSVLRPPTVKGSYRVAPGIKERHSIENLGDLSSDFLRVELKGVSLEMKEPFRGKAPQGSTGSEDVVEFTAPGLKIERIVCGGTAACHVLATSAPSLLVAFSPCVMTVAGKREEMQSGDVRWVTASQTVEVEASPPAHLLRVVLQPK